MSTRTRVLDIYVNKKRFRLRESQLIQSGGEGMVFELGGAAVKLYHSPQPYHEAKLIDWIDGPKRARAPINVLAPTALVHDRRGNNIGFLMPLLGAGMAPVKHLSNPLYWGQYNLKLTQAIELFQEIHRTLSLLHHQGIVVGDLNDNNIFFDLTLAGSGEPANQSQWIDTDSYQFDHHLCRVASEGFLDPALYGVGSFGQTQFFSPLSDWYAFHTLLVKSLLQVHPYGGVHRKFKSLRSRAQNRVSILDPEVSYPIGGRPIESLSDELLHHMHLVFEKGNRLPYPRKLLHNCAASLVSCAICSLSYPSQRRGCPACRHQTPSASPPASTEERETSCLFQIDGFIDYVTLRPSGRLIVIFRQGEQYGMAEVGVGGELSRKPLFQGRPGYRFGHFGNQLAVNPPNDNRLMLLDLSGASPQMVSMIETAQFVGEAVFASTPWALYRNAGNWIVRGALQQGHFVEEAIDMAHRCQTRFWGSPYDDVIAGYHRMFGDQTTFIVDASKGRRSVELPPLRRGERVTETAIRFGPGSVAVVRLMSQSGGSYWDTVVCSLDGSPLHHGTSATDPFGIHVQPKRYPVTADISLPSPPFHPLPAPIVNSSENRFWIHPAGIVVQKPRQIQLIHN
jgi:hypothetical protein